MTKDQQQVLVDILLDHRALLDSVAFNIGYPRTDEDAQKLKSAEEQSAEITKLLDTLPHGIVTEAEKSWSPSWPIAYFELNDKEEGK